MPTQIILFSTMRPKFINIFDNYDNKRVYSTRSALENYSSTPDPASFMQKV
jgi:hypothetical protein